MLSHRYLSPNKVLIPYLQTKWSVKGFAGGKRWAPKRNRERLARNILKPGDVRIACGVFKKAIFAPAHPRRAKTRPFPMRGRRECGD